MPGAIIAIDQDRPGSISYGSPGVARKDLWVGRTVHLRSTAPGTQSYAWSILAGPPGSATTVTDASVQNVDLVLDTAGPYRVQLITDGGGAGNVQVLVVAATFDSSGQPVMRGWRLPAFGETAGEDNFNGNDRGYAPDFEYILADIAQALSATHAYVSLTEVTVGPAGSAATYVCDGANDEEQINAAIVAVAGVPGKPGTVYVLPGNYNIGAPILYRSNVVVRGGGGRTSNLRASFDFASSNYFLIGAIGQQTTNIANALQTNAARGDTVLQVTPNDDLTNILPGDVLLLGSSRLWEPTNTSGQRQGEYLCVAAVGAVVNPPGGSSYVPITIRGMLRDDYARADEPFLYRMSFVENVVLQDLAITQVAPQGGRIGAPPLVCFQRTRNFVIERCELFATDGPGIGVHSSIDGTITNCELHDFTDSGPNTTGFGVAFSGASERVVVAHNRIARARHAVTSAPLPAPDDGSLLIGVCRDVIVSDNVAGYCTSSPYNTHAGTDGFLFEGNIATSTDSFGFFVRGRATRVLGNTVDSCSQGIKVGSNIVSDSSGTGAGSMVLGNTLRNLRKGSADYAVGISLGQTDHVVVKDNVVTGCDGAGIELRAGAHFNVVEGNTLLDCNLANNREGDPNAPIPVYPSMDAVYLEGGAAGTTATMALNGTVVTMTGMVPSSSQPGTLSASDIGKRVVVSGGSAPGNNGVFPITNVLGASSVQWTNPLAVADTNSGHISWAVEGVCDNVIVGNLARNTPEVAAVDPGMVGHAQYFLRSRPGNGGPQTNFRNIIKDNTGLNMAVGVLLGVSGNYAVGNSNNEATPGALTTGTPIDSMFYAAPFPAVTAMDRLTGFYYVRSITTGVWSSILLTLNNQVYVPASDFAFAVNVLNPGIRQLPTTGATGQPLTFRAQDAAQTGGDIVLQAGAGTTPGVVRLGPAGGVALVVGNDIEITTPTTVNRGTGSTRVTTDERDATTTTNNTSSLYSFTIDPNTAVTIDIEVQGIASPGAGTSRWYKKTRAFLSTNGTFSDGIERLIDTETLGDNSGATWTVAIERLGNAVSVNVNSGGQKVTWYVLSQSIRTAAALS